MSFLIKVVRSSTPVPGPSRSSCFVGKAISFLFGDQARPIAALAQLIGRTCEQFSGPCIEVVVLLGTLVHEYQQRVAQFGEQGQVNLNLAHTACPFYAIEKNFGAMSGLGAGIIMTPVPAQAWHF